MKKVLIAFDIDGTLRDNRNDASSHPMVDSGQLPVANERIRTLLITLASFKNTKIMVWSGGGELYARQITAALGLSKYVDCYAGKWITEGDGMGVRTPHPDLKPDIAIDDIQDCVLGAVNLIVCEK